MNPDGSLVSSELRVLVVSDREITRAGIASVLQPFRDRVRVVGEVNRIDDALPDESGSEMVLFDVRLGRCEGLDEVGRLTKG
jgi:DNA-binding NarL/FixJ family response regulator